MNPASAESGPTGACGRSTRRPGYTLLEAIFVMACVLIAIVIAVIAVPASRENARRDKDTQQIRGIQQALVIWVPCNGDDYPLPSRLDKFNHTVPEIGDAKNTTANIYSILLFNGALTPEILVSPVETNPSIVPKSDYQMQRPPSAVDPGQALWDPSLSVALDGSRPGNVSYAHAQPCGPRRARWSNSFGATEAVLASRGPEISDLQQQPDGSVIPTLANANSFTLRFFGRGHSWSGNVAFNDNHVEFWEDEYASNRPVKPKPDRLYKDTAGKSWPDLLFADEPDKEGGANTYLGIFTKAGATPSDYKAVWD